MLDLSTNKVGGGPTFLRTDLSTRSKKKIKVSIKQQFASTNKNYESNVLISSVTALSKKQTTNNKKNKAFFKVPLLKNDADTCHIRPGVYDTVVSGNILFEILKDVRNKWQRGYVLNPEIVRIPP